MMKFVLAVIAVCWFAGVNADFPHMKYHIQNLWGCEGEYGSTTKYNWKCKQWLHADSDEYIKLSKDSPSAFEIIATGKPNEYKIKVGNKYLSYKNKLQNWAVVDASDNYIIWEILPRGHGSSGYLLRIKYNCPGSWPCNQELTTGNQDKEFAWIENGFVHSYRIIPAE